MTTPAQPPAPVPAPTPAAGHPWTPPPVLARPDPLPAQPVGFEHVLRGPGHTKWRPLAVLGLAVAFYSVASTVVGILTGIPLGIAVFDHMPALDSDDSLEIPMEQIMQLLFDDPGIAPWMMLLVNLSWAVAIPAAVCAIWLATKVRPGFAASVAGRFRWGWFGRLIAWLVPLWVVYLAVGHAIEPAAFDGPPGTTGQVALLIAVIVLTTPLQAAGEEFAFRGLLLQSVTAWFSNRAVGLAVATTASALVFAVGHMSLDPWVLASVATMAVAACFVTWRTGGLEAAVAIHIVNNLLAIGYAVATIGLGGSLISPGTTMTPVDFLGTLGVNAAAVAIILWQARRHGVQTRTAR